MTIRFQFSFIFTDALCSNYSGYNDNCLKLINKLLLIILILILFCKAYSLISWLAASCMSGKGPTTALSPSLSFSIKPKDQNTYWKVELTIIFLLQLFLLFQQFNHSFYIHSWDTMDINFSSIIFSCLTSQERCHAFITCSNHFLHYHFNKGKGSFFLIAKECKSVCSKFHYKPFIFSIHDSCHSTSESFPVQIKFDKHYILMSHSSKRSDYCTSDINNY